MDGRLTLALAFALALALALPGCSTPAPQAPTPPTVDDSSTPTPTGDVELTLAPVADGFQQPVLVLEDPSTGALVVVEQAGRLVTVEHETLLDITDRVASGGERGFLGFAFHPDDPDVGFASYTDLDGNSILSRFTRNGAPAFDAASEEILLKVEQPYANHNGGNVLYGPDGFLYWGLGDGGAGGDPQDRAQDKEDLLGSMLRIDVGATGAATAPADNPYVGRDGHDLVWAKGLRNPWRFSFDRATGDLYIGDVGQDQQEEIDFQPASSRGGENYGWSAWEGTHRYDPTRTTDETPIAPIATYATDEGCAVTGGFVYRGSAIPDLVGTYVYSDYCHGDVYGLWRDGSGWTTRLLLATDHSVSSFGEDADGELYVVDHGGAVLRIVAG